MTTKKFIFPLMIFSALVALAVVGRLVPHYPNFTPVAATALFGSFLLRRRFAIFIPLTAMLVSDLFIGFYEWKIMLVVYAALSFPILFGELLRRRLQVTTVAASSLAASVVFFTTTNFAVWFFGSMYSHGLKGLLECYAAGVPFFKYTLAGDAFWAASLFSAYALVRYVKQSVPRLSALAWAPSDSQALTRG